MVSPEDFNHEAHLRLAYVYLVENSLAGAQEKFRGALIAFLAANNIPATKFHETLTRAWVLAVRHFMNRHSCSSFSEFASQSKPLLDSRVMLTHYTKELLFSPSARASFVEPDLEVIPQ
jgi:hypothetical protein